MSAPTASRGGWRRQAEEPASQDVFVHPDELARMKQIAENQRKLEELRLRQCKTGMEEMTAGQAARVRPRKRAKQETTGPTRCSARNPPRPNYKEQSVNANEWDDGYRKERKPREPSNRARPTVPFQSEAAISAAADAAEEKARALGSVHKRLSYSMVHQGFWMNVPQVFARAWPQHKDDHNIRLLSSEQENMAGNWQARWLVSTRKAGGTGFSGGWRGFACDHGLTANDSIAFESVKETGALPIIRIHIFRAKDFEPVAMALKEAAPVKIKGRKRKCAN